MIDKLCCSKNWVGAHSCDPDIKEIVSHEHEQAHRAKGQLKGPLDL